MKSIMNSTVTMLAQWDQGHIRSVVKLAKWPSCNEVQRGHVHPPNEVLSGIAISDVHAAQFALGGVVSNQHGRERANEPQPSFWRPSYLCNDFAGLMCPERDARAPRVREGASLPITSEVSELYEDQSGDI